MENALKSNPAGHAAHIQGAATTSLTGEMSREIRLTFLGAGSFFAPRLVNDLVRIPGNHGGTIALVDIDAVRLRITARLVEKLLVERGAEGWTVAAAVDRRSVLAGSHYVVNCIEVHGAECVHWDNEIPAKYGVDQCIGDTIGPGGLFKALRTIPVWLEILRDCERLCPGAVVLNYTNPMSMLCLAAGRTSPIQVVGLCHSVQHTHQQLAEYADVPVAELEFDCAGINHLAWFTRLAHRGQDLYPRLREKFARDLALAHEELKAGRGPSDSRDLKWGSTDDLPYRATDLVRKDLCLHFGAFVTESSGHVSEYLPYYRKSGAGREMLRLGYDGGSRFYARNWPKWRADADRERESMLRGEISMEWERSWEYASWIIEAREKDAPFRIYGNVINQVHGAGQLITNLPADGCVEVPCLVDRNGVRPLRFGPLPPQLAALSASNMSVFDLGAQAGIERSIEKTVYALMLDPLTAAVCTPAEIKKMALELFAAEADFLPGYH